MKKSAWLFVGIMAAAVACNDDESEAPQAISSDEAAVMVASSFSSNSSGFASVSKEASEESGDIVEDNSSGRVQACGVSQNIDLSGASPDGGLISWSYDFSYKFRLNCNSEDKPENIVVNLSYSGDYSDSKFAIDHSGLAELDVRGLAETEANFNMNGFYKRAGSFEIKTGDKKSGSSNVEITVTSIIVDKQTHKIIGGTGTFLLTGSASGKGEFKYEGEVEFKGSDSAELKIKGDVFVMNLVNGECTKK
jgi:hypothetical protein